MTIDVFLDTTANPAVTVDPRQKDKDKGKDKITWKRGKDQDFSFVSVSFNDNPAWFTPDPPKKGGKEVTASDDNTTDGSVGDFPYVITVESNGTRYTSKRRSPGDTQGDPVIRNKPGGG